jgi:D-alanine-D-alanine ligase
MSSSEERVVVLAGGLSPEREVSQRSGRRVAEALRVRGMEVEVRDVDASLLPALTADPPSCVVPMLHRATGETRLRDVLAALGLPFVGSTAAACRGAFDKPVALAQLAAAGIDVPRSVSLPHATFRELGAAAVMSAVVRAVGLPAVVKPTRGGSALGVAVVRDEADLPAAMVGAFAYGDTVMIEEHIPGTEVAVCVLDDGAGEGPRTLPAVEIRPDDDFYSYAARYTAGATEFFVPARLPEPVLQAAAHAALTAHRTLGLRDWSRSDVVVDADGVPWFLEVNVAPGMTETSTYPQAVVASGSDLGTLTTALVERALAR